MAEVIREEEDIHVPFEAGDEEGNGKINKVMIEGEDVVVAAAFAEDFRATTVLETTIALKAETDVTILTIANMTRLLKAVLTGTAVMLRLRTSDNALQ